MNRVESAEVPPGGWRLVASRPGSPGALLPVAYFLGLALLVFLPLLGRGFLLSLDMVFAPNTAYVEYLFASSDPLYFGRLPIAVLLDAAATVAPNWLLQRVLLVSTVAGSGVMMYRACGSRTTLGALFAGTLFAINPFVYVRLLAGHWWLLLGYAVLPIAVVSYADAIADTGTPRRAAGWATVASAFDPHVAVLLAVAYTCLGSVALVRSEGRAVVERTMRVGGIAVALNAYWLLPAVATVLAGRSKVTAMGGLDLLAFGARGTIGGNVPLSIATLLGFWRGGYRLPIGPIPEWAWIGLFAGLLLAVFAGWYHARNEPSVDGLFVVGIVGFLLGLGVSVDATAPLFRALYEHAVVFRGMRDSQKFVALLVLAYAFLGARGVDRLVDWVERWDRPVVVGVFPGGTGVTGSLPTPGTVLRASVVVLVLATPLVYTWPMLWGFSGQLSPTDYPDSWAAANEHFVGDDEPYRVLFLPWHQYLTFPWLDGRIANPADAYFERPVIRGRSIDVGGIDSQAASPTHERVAVLLEDPSPSDSVGPELARLGVKYVVVSDVAGARRYDAVVDRPEFAAVLANDDLVVYENRAFEDAPPPAAWPRARSVVPWTALVIGGLFSVLATFLTVPNPGRRWLSRVGTPTR